MIPATSLSCCYRTPQFFSVRNVRITTPQKVLTIFLWGSQNQICGVTWKSTKNRRTDLNGNETLAHDYARLTAHSKLCHMGGDVGALAGGWRAVGSLTFAVIIRWGLRFCCDPTNWLLTKFFVGLTTPQMLLTKILWGADLWFLWGLVRSENHWFLHQISFFVWRQPPTCVCCSGKHDANIKWPGHNFFYHWVCIP